MSRRRTRSAEVHSVHLYDEPSALVERLCGLVNSCIGVGNSLVMVITAEHRSQLLKALSSLEIDVREAARGGRFVLCDADETLALLMKDGRTDPALFTLHLERVLNEAKRAARDKDNSLTVFGEMVALLWERGDKKSALELEKLWNTKTRGGAFELHCAYARKSFSGDTAVSDLVAICDQHTHVLADDRRPVAA